MRQDPPLGRGGKVKGTCSQRTQRGVGAWSRLQQAASIDGPGDRVVTSSRWSGGGPGKKEKVNGRLAVRKNKTLRPALWGTDSRGGSGREQAIK